MSLTCPGVTSNGGDAPLDLAIVWGYPEIADFLKSRINPPLLSEPGMYVCTVLLEYFAGEEPLRMSRISRKFDPLRSTIAFSGKDRVYLLVII